MSVCGEIENLEEEIRQYQQKIRQAYERIDKLKKIRPMSSDERQRARQKQAENNINVSPRDIHQAWYDGDGSELFY